MSSETSKVGVKTSVAKPTDKMKCAGIKYI